MTVRIAHLSDIHFGTENAQAIAGVSAWLAASPPDLYVVTGDLTTGGAPAEFAGARVWLIALNAPTLVVPGNHDTPYLGIWERLTAPFARYTQAVGQAADDILLLSPAATVAGINTARGVQLRSNWSKGALAAAQSRRALDRLSGGASGSLAIIACHHPLIEMVGGPMSAEVRGGKAAAKVLCEGGVDLILSGHVHAPFAAAMPHGDRKTYAVGAGTLSIRERGAPPSFNLIEADAREIRVTALAWAAGAVTPWRDWTFTRRGGS